jgi:ribosome-associated protein YbcJ (S4-like RNA binding protein)
MSFNNRTALASLGVMLIATSAMAQGAMTGTSIKQLPKEGQVTISGTVDNMENNREFTLRDLNGDTVEIEAKTDLNIKEGDRVEVSGVIDSSFMGMDKEIDATTVTVQSRVNQNATVTDTHNNKVTSNQRNDSTLIDTKPMNQQAASQTGIHANSNHQQAQSGEHSAIEQLPTKGDVTLTGFVDSVDMEERSFTLRDNAGETIDVHTAGAISFREGDKVKVNGQMTDEMAGVGEQIVSANVQVLSNR